ncbi:asparaginase-domain-containing protein [Gorgonomyces haynaldii]|nr:asparaginase-domain-containing protein [Gorgonomyces haynaldii]
MFFQNDFVAVQKDSDDIVSAHQTRVLIIYTGGTIGMANHHQNGYLPVKGFINTTLEQNPRFHDKQAYELLSQKTNRVNIQSQDTQDTIMINGTLSRSRELPTLLTPVSLYGKRIRYSILEYDPLLDSSNMTMADWVKIATDVELNYRLYDAFLILHGTDTMAYTASALSFMLENLGKTVILTGSQVPLSEVRNDAVDNLLNALIIAGHFVIPEVGLFFDNKLFRGNRSSKVNALDFDAFDSPNLRPLVKVGINIDVSWSDVFRPKKIEKFKSWKVMQPSVASLRIFPGITSATVRAFLAPPINGVVLETYGSGNAPSNRPDLLEIIREACERGGLVTDIYETGKALVKVGVIPGSDMTPECALTKLSYLLGRYSNVDMIRSLIRRNLRGELTVPIRKQRFSYIANPQSGGFVQSILSLLGVASTPLPTDDIEDSGREEETHGLERVMVPLLLCQAVRTGDLQAVRAVLNEYDTLINVPDYDGRTPLHVAVSEGKLEMTEYLLTIGANLHLRDRFGHSPLFDAVRFRHKEIVDLLVAGGAHFAQEEAIEVTWMLCQSARNGDLELCQMLIQGGADLNQSVSDDRTPLHLAVSYNHLDIVKLLMRQQAVPGRRMSVGALAMDAVNLNDLTMKRTVSLTMPTPLNIHPVDRFGNTPLMEAKKLGNQEMIDLFQN